MSFCFSGSARLLLALIFGAASLQARAGESLMESQNRYDSPIHYRPKMGSVGDVIPFYWKGTYHIFYLHAGMKGMPWDHIDTRDLIHWNEDPIALRADGPPGSPDGTGLGTGSVTEKDGTFHVFYTGFTVKDHQGIQYTLHSTSLDLNHWTKQPADTFTGDGVTYKSTDFRDPFVFWNDAANSFWMLLCGRNVTDNHAVQAVAESTDLKTWKQLKPLVENVVQPGNVTEECPDLFRIGSTWYLLHSSWKKNVPAISGTFVRYAPDIHGTYNFSPSAAIDTSVVYAAKSMSDGKRRVITGWVRDLADEKDGGEDLFGGDQSVPREIYERSVGQLGFRPVVEAVNQFGHVETDSSQDPKLEQLPLAADVPDNYFLDGSVQVDPAVDFIVTLRQGAQKDSGYRLILKPAKNEVELAGRHFSFPRHVDVDWSKPVKLQIFVQGSIIECFVADAYAFTCRAYDFRSGKLAMQTSGGSAKIEQLTVKTHEDPDP